MCSGFFISFDFRCSSFFLIVRLMVAFLRLSRLFWFRWFWCGTSCYRFRVLKERLEKRCSKKGQRTAQKAAMARIRRAQEIQRELEVIEVRMREKIALYISFIKMVKWGFKSSREKGSKRSGKRIQK